VRQKSFYVYILASQSRVLYCGVTNRLERRVREHQSARAEGFTKRYRVHRLVYFETFREPRSAITREKVIKGWIRAKKLALIESVSPTWEDLVGEVGPLVAFVARAAPTADPSLRSG
jgi:putative endonuclease